MTDQLEIPLEMQRRTSQRQRILTVLIKYRRGSVTNLDLQRITAKYTQRISELRQDGHDIQAVYHRPGLYYYWYKGKRDV